MKFDVAIMNPPYSRDLHLDILSEVIKHCDKVVNISPIRWLQDPLDKYKAHPKQEKYRNIVEKMEDLSVIPPSKAMELFSARFVMELGIYVVGKGGWKNPVEFPIIDKVVSYVQQSKDCLGEHIVYDKVTGICSLVRCIGHNKSWDNPVRNFNILVHNSTKGREMTKDDQRGWNFYTDGINERTGETYLEYSIRTAWGKVKPKDIASNVKFKDKTERENFFLSWTSRTMEYVLYNMCSNANLPDKFLPWLDPSKVWTDADLCKEFGITGYISETEAVPGSEWDTILKAYDCK